MNRIATGIYSTIYVINKTELQEQKETKEVKQRIKTNEILKLVKWGSTLQVP